MNGICTCKGVHHRCIGSSVLNSTDKEVGFVHSIELKVWFGGDNAASSHRFSYEGPRTLSPNCPLICPSFAPCP